MTLATCTRPDIELEIFSSLGKVYWLKVYQLPVASRAARGKPFVNLLPLEEGEKINALLPIREFTENKFIFIHIVHDKKTTGCK